MTRVLLAVVKPRSGAAAPEVLDRATLLLDVNDRGHKVPDKSYTEPLSVE